MARPTKQGVDYFPIDVQFDDKVEIFVSICGAEGLGILITIWQLIYQNHGYYVADNEYLCPLIRRRTMSEITTIQEVINESLKLNIFNGGLHSDHKILTSSGIQKRYLIASKQKKSINININYLCSGVSMPDNAVNIAGNATKVDVDVKEDVKGDKKKPKIAKNENKRTYGIAENVKLTGTQYQKLIDKIGEEMTTLYIDKISTWAKVLTIKDAYLTVLSWWTKDGKPKPKKQDSKYSEEQAEQNRQQQEEMDNIKKQFNLGIET